MPLPILQPSTNLETQIRGDVIIDDSAIIADGVILNASQGSKIIIGAGACLGMGTIINAYQGNVEIKESVILGSGTLIVGACIIGTQASLGASVTVYNATIEPRTVIPAGTVIGDRSRQLELSTLHENNSQNNSQDISQGISEHNGKLSDEQQDSQQLHQFVNPYSQYKISSPPLKNNNTDEEKLEQEKTEEKKLSETQKSEEIDSPPEKNSQNQFKTETVETEKNDSVAEEVTNEVEVQNEVNQDGVNGKGSIDEVVETDPWDNENLPTKSDSVVGKVYINKLLYTLFPHKN